MRKFLLKVALFMLLVLILAIVSVFLPDYGNEGNLLYSLTDKHARLEATASPRVIFVGGSNLLFGLDSQMASDSLGMPVVNMGCNAGLGLRYILEDVVPFVRAGDKLVIVPEYAHFYDQSPSTYAGQDELLTTVFDVYPQGISHISPDHWLSLVIRMPNYIGNKYFSFFRYMFTPKHRIGAQAVYERDKLNSYGDIIGHLEMPGEAIKPMPVHKTAKPVDPHVVAQINRIGAELKARGADVYFMPTCYQDSSFDNTLASISAIKDSWKGLTVPVLADPARYRLPSDLFWDTPEHLNARGRAIRTQMVIADLRPVLLTGSENTAHSN